MSIWVGMAACIPTYILASYMIKSGLNWMEALVIIFVANLIVTVPMVLNGHGGVKYGVPFAVLGRAPFGVVGVHVPTLVRALVACGWFGIQVWIGGLAIHAIACTLVGSPIEPGATVGKFVAFAFSWLFTLFFVWRGTESIRQLESFAAPVLLMIGVLLVAWGLSQGGGFAAVLDQNKQLELPTAEYQADGSISLAPLRNLDGAWKADSYRIASASRIDHSEWHPIGDAPLLLTAHEVALYRAEPNDEDLAVQFRRDDMLSSPIPVAVPATPPAKISSWLLWMTAMVGFWATMSISIADITRYGLSQRKQVVGQFLGLPGTMLFYSFVSVFVTCAALIGFDGILIVEDAPWNPVSLLSRFDNPIVVIIAQLFLFVATLTTNIAANVIAPANAFANLWPQAISFRTGGLLTGLIGACIAPWLLLDRIGDLLVFISGFLGPVLGVMLADYFWVRRTRISLPDLYDPEGAYSYRNGVNVVAMAALAVGVAFALAGYFVSGLRWLYTASWFSGCLVSFIAYGLFMSRTGARANVWRNA